MTSIAPCEVEYSSYRVLEGGKIQFGYDRCAVALAVRLALDPREPLEAVARRAQWRERRLNDQCRRIEEARLLEKQRRQRQWEEWQERHPPPARHPPAPIAHPTPRQPPAPIAPVLVFAPPYVGSQAEEKAASDERAKMDISL